MLKRLFNWLGLDESPGTDPVSHQPLPDPDIRTEPERIDAFLPEKPDEESLIRNKYVREDTGTHETLKILDDSIIDSGEEEGFDPYNTGDFDRSQNWQRRFRS